MLTCYPIEATNENWLHDALVEMIIEIHRRLNANENLIENQPTWRALVPNSLDNAQRENLITSTGIRDRLFLYNNAVVPLSLQEREEVLSVMNDQNRIADLLIGIGAINTVEHNYPDVHKAAFNLFLFCYEKLTDFNVRERQYQIVFDALETKICPFCGIERVMNPTETAQDQDHYLAKSIYPFAAANMRNLVPMCRCCNRDYKKTIDVIRPTNGQRRMAFDPYHCEPPSITLLHSTIDDDSSPPLPGWNIEFIPASEQAETWDSIFQVRTRYTRDILNEYFDKWLSGFAGKCTKDRDRGIIQGELSDEDIRRYVSYYCEDKAASPNIGMAGFLEPLVFEFLLSQFDQGNQRIIQLIRDAVLGIVIEEVVS